MEPWTVMLGIVLVGILALALLTAAMDDSPGQSDSVRRPCHSRPRNLRAENDMVAEMSPAAIAARSGCFSVSLVLQKRPHRVPDLLISGRCWMHAVVLPLSSDR